MTIRCEWHSALRRITLVVPKDGIEGEVIFGTGGDTMAYIFMFVFFSVLLALLLTRNDAVLKIAVAAGITCYLIGVIAGLAFMKIVGAAVMLSLGIAFLIILLQSALKDVSDMFVNRK